MVLRNGSTLSSDWSEANGTGADAGTSQAIRVDELDHFDEDWVKPFPLRDGVRIRKGEKFADYYTLYEEIGEGKFGKVYRCVEKATNLMLAAKCIKIRKDTDFEKVEKEVNIMTQMRHKCIAQIYDAFATSDNDVILVMEIVQGGELFDRVADDSYILTEMAVALIMFQICEAIRYIHSQNIIHLDLKPENIMCISQTSNQIKLIDFGLAQWYDGSKDLMFMAGTPEFAAPEVIKYEPLDFHTDMWSLGVIAYILLSGQSPFLGETLAHTYCNVERGNWMFCEEFAENGISSEAKDFISRLLIVEKEKRILPDECLQHPWIAQNRERAFLASRAASPAVCHPLAVDKFRKYVKNKRFRRLVFGVLFINQVMRMMQTMQRNKSAHGVEYVRNMLVAAEAAAGTGIPGDGIEAGVEDEDTGRSLLLKAFSKKSVLGASKKEEIGRKEEKMEVDEAENPKLGKKAGREHGEKKKRSKSDARRAAEQQRTRSSTEQTSSKKQRQEEEKRKESSPEGWIREKESAPAKKLAKEQKETKSVTFEEKPKVPKLEKSPLMPRKRVGDGQVLKMAARMQEERATCTPSTSAEKRAPPPEVIKTAAASNVSALLKRLEQKGQQQQGGKSSTPAEGEGGRPITPIKFAVTAIQPPPQKSTDQKTKEGDERKKKMVVKVVKKKVRRVRTTGEEEQQEKRREEDEQQPSRTSMLSRREMEKAAFRERIAGMEQRATGTATAAARTKLGEERDEKRMKNGHGTAMKAAKTKEAIGKAASRRPKEQTEMNGCGEIQKVTELAKQQQATGMISPRAKQLLKLSKSHPLEARRTKEESMDEMDGGWGVVGQDVFDFSLLRKKLQNRILGLKDQDDLATEAENQQRFELQKQQKMLQTNLNIKRAMRKWISMDKDSKQQQQSFGNCQGRTMPVAIPDWAR